MTYSFAGGTAVLKLNRKSDLTTISLVQRVAKPPAREEPVAKADSIDAMTKQALQMAQRVDALTGKPSAKAQAANEPPEVLQPLANNDGPVPLPNTAEDVAFSDGKLEFTSDSGVKSVADFYRANMKRQGWQSQSSVINNANMVVLNFAKARQTVSFTILRMGAKTNVSADGSGLKILAAKVADSTVAPPNGVSTAPVQASPDDLVAEDSGGLPVPKRHSLAANESTPFRRELKANVSLELTTVLEFYRRELGKLGWKEENNSAVAAQDTAVASFVSAEGPGLLKLARKDGETTISLVVKNPDAALKLAWLPKPGRPSWRSSIQTTQRPSLRSTSKRSRLRPVLARKALTDRCSTCLRANTSFQPSDPASLCLTKKSPSAPTKHGACCWGLAALCRCRCIEIQFWAFAGEPRLMILFAQT